MNNQTDTASPEMLDKADQGNGGARVNRLPAILIAVAIIVVLLSFVYTGHHRRVMREAQASVAEQEKYKVSGVVSPPIQKPAGPDVVIPATPPQQVNVQGQPVAAMQEPEWIKRQREARMQMYQSALASGIEMKITAPNQVSQQQQLGAPMPAVNGTVPLVPPPPQYGGEEALPKPDPAGSAQERAFLAASDPNASTYLKHSKHPAISPYEIKAGAVIPAVMKTGLTSELSGECSGQVLQDVYDSATGMHLLIPAGSGLTCTYDTAIDSGQSRIFVAWKRIIYPDSSSISLDSMPGADQSGLAGFQDQVDNHYVRTFGQAFLLSMITAGVQLSQPRGSVQGTYNAQQIGAAAIGQQFGMLAMQQARRNLYLPPTLKIRPGAEVTVAVNKDMVFDGPWKGHPMAQKVSRVEE